MSKVVSQRQIDANRRNAQLSTGPRTKRGKRRSAENSIKHGLLARNVILTCDGFDENRADFDKLVTSLVQELEPTSILEQTLVERIATCHWRLQRAQRFEVDALRASITEVTKPNDNKVEDLQRTRRYYQRQLELINLARVLLDQPPDKRTPAQAEELYQTMLKLTNNWSRLPTDQATSVDELKTGLDGIYDFCERDLDRIEKKLKAAIHEREINDIERQKSASIPENDSLARVVRYESMLDRQIHRALTQLRNLRGATRQTPKASPRASLLKPAVAETRKRRRPKS